MKSDSQPNRSNCSAVILAGGLNSRMGGRNKAFLDLGPATIIERILATLQPLFAEIMIVTRDPGLYAGQPCRIVEDVIAVRASLTGVHAGLKHAREEYIFVVPCDVPFLKPALVELLLDEIDTASDAIVPVYDQHYEPLCAIYNRRCIPHIETLLAAGDLTIYHLYDHIHLKTVAASRIRRVDPGRESFFNVNTPEAYQRALAHVQHQVPLEIIPG